VAACGCIAPPASCTATLLLAIWLLSHATIYIKRQDCCQLHQNSAHTWLLCCTAQLSIGLASAELAPCTACSPWAGTHHVSLQTSRTCSARRPPCIRKAMRSLTAVLLLSSADVVCPWCRIHHILAVQRQVSDEQGYPVGLPVVSATHDVDGPLAVPKSVSKVRG
jgi:hypothetical protein